MSGEDCNRVQFLTPNDAPTETICRRIRIPDSEAWMALVNGALVELIHADHWEQFGTLTPEESAERAQAMFLEFLSDECEPEFSPSDIDGLRLWFDASDPSTLYQNSALTTPAVNDGDVVGGWKDKAPLSQHITQTTTANKPTLKLNVLNGLPILRLDGGDWLSRASVAGSSFVSANKGYFAAVWYENTTSPSNNTLIDWNAPGQGNRYLIHATYSDVIYFDFGNTGGGGRISVGQPAGWGNNWHILECWRNGSQGIVAIDGTTILTGAFSDDLDITQISTLYIGGLSGGPGLGDIAELLVYNDAPDSGHRSELRAYLRSKWGLSGV